MMDKTININIAGILFKIDEDAYGILRDYLKAINNRFRNVQGGHETVEDIESRIAEIFQSQKGMAGVITRENIEAMISIMGKPEDFGQNEHEADQPGYTFQRKRLYRNPDDSIISGVCGGLGAYLDTDPVLFRILFAIFAVFFGIGFLLYIILWIALPNANTDAKKRELHGNSYYSVQSRPEQSYGTFSSSSSPYYAGYNNTSKIGNAFNEVFRAIGSVCFIILRIFLIIAGVALVLTGFLAILSFVMIFVIKYPVAFTTNVDSMNLSYLPQFLNFIVSPSVVPWIIILTSTVVIVPLLALIYWGVKMIFWFKANDGILSLAGLVLWVLSLTALSIIMFSEGVGYSENGKSISNNILKVTPDTLYIKAGKRIRDLRYDHMISIPHDHKGYDVFIEEDSKEVFVRTTYLKLEASYDRTAMVEVSKYSFGRNKSDAILKADALQYNYRFAGDTLFLDEYFTFPSERKWSFDYIGVTLFAPEGTITNFDNMDETIIQHSLKENNARNIENSTPKKGFWKLTKEGLMHTEP